MSDYTVEHGYGNSGGSRAGWFGGTRYSHCRRYGMLSEDTAAEACEVTVAVGGRNWHSTFRRDTIELLHEDKLWPTQLQLIIHISLN